MTDVTKIHEEKKTLSVDVNIPGHAPRKETAIYEHTRKQRLEKEDRCWICNATAEESGHPLETHHWVVERCLAEAVDWDLVKADCLAGIHGEDAKNFDWSSFDSSDPYTFVDNMMVNGKVLCKKHHIGKDEGVHYLTYPLWLFQRYAKEGYDYSNVEIIHHFDE